MEKKDDSIRVDLTTKEANIIIEALGNLPFSQVYKLIEKIHLSAQKSSNGES